MNYLRVDDAAKSVSPDGTVPAAGSGANRAPWQTPEVEDLRISGASQQLGHGADGGGDTGATAS